MFSNILNNWSIFAIIFVWCIRHICQASDYEFRIDILPACNENSKNLIRLETLDFMKMNHNRFISNGSLVIDEIVNGPIQLMFVTNRCNNDKNICEDFNEVAFDDACDSMTTGGFITFADIVAHMIPNLTCPLQPNRYNWTNGRVNLESIARLPLSGYSWVTSVRAYEILDTENTKKQLIFCYTFRANLIKINHLRQKKTRNH